MIDNSKHKFAKYFLPDQKKAKQRSFKKAKIVKSIFKLTPQLKKIGKNKFAYIKTYGCQANIRDSETIVGLLKSCGYQMTNEQTKADLIILNTCAIRENAEQKVFGELGHLKHAKKKKDVLIGVCGCMVQQHDVAKQLRDQTKHVDFVFGTHNIHMLPEILLSCNDNKRNFCIFSEEGKIYENLPVTHTSPIKAFVNITYGCDKFCSYCVVPMVRGSLRSRKKEDIVDEVKQLIKKGYKEVTLIGQNVNSYGIDLYDNYFFVDLLIDVAKTKIPRLRFTTCNPWNFNKKIIDAMVKYKNIMPAIHLPIQSGDEQILKAMNRAMDIDKYYEIIDLLRNKLPSVSISTDLIVGFPNETDEQFANTLKMYERIKFDNAYTFIYSPRKDTPAAKINDKISLATKEKRLTHLNEIVRKYAKWNCDRYIGKTIKVLVEGASKKNKNVLTGYSPEWKVVNFTGDAKIGDIVNVKVLTSSRFSLNGKQI